MRTKHAKLKVPARGIVGSERIADGLPLTAGRLVVLVMLAAGCGATDGLVPVAGVVELDGDPLARTAVTFHPVASSSGAGGMAITDSSGRFEVYSPQGKKGMAAGEYKVTLSRREPKVPVVEGSAVIESDLTEFIPAKYSDLEKTELTATIGPKGDAELRFRLSDDDK